MIPKGMLDSEKWLWEGIGSQDLRGELMMVVVEDRNLLR